MNAAKVHSDVYMDFLIATPKACSATEAARVHPDGLRPPAHDAFTRLLTRLEHTRPANHVGVRDGVRPWFFQGGGSA